MNSVYSDRVYPSIHLCLLYPEWGHLDNRLLWPHSHLLQPMWQDPKVFPGQLRDIVPPEFPGPSSGPPEVSKSPQNAPVQVPPR